MRSSDSPDCFPISIMGRQFFQCQNLVPYSRVDEASLCQIYKDRTLGQHQSVNSRQQNGLFGEPLPIAKEDELDVQKRLARAKVELEYAETPGTFDKIIINDDVKSAYKELSKYTYQ
jgi:hypothetical protein